MNSVMRLSFFILLAVIGSPAVVKADSGNTCDQALGASTLSSEVQSYLKFVNHHIERSGGQLDPQIANQILKANHFVNPFKNRTDTLSGQIARAIARLDGKINASEWAGLQSEIKNIIDRTQSGEQDRQRKAEETATVFNPQIADKKPVPPTVVRRDFSSIRFKDRILVSFKTQGNLLLIYEIVGEELIFISEEPIGTSGPGAWRVVDDRLFLAVGTSDKMLHFYELIGNQLKLVDHYEAGSSVVAVESSWQVVGDRLLLAAVNQSGEALLFEFFEGRLKAKFSQEAAADFSKTPIWHIEGDRAFLIFTNDLRGCALLYEVINNRLEFKDEACGERDNRSADLSLQIIQGRVLIAMGGSDTYVHLFELANATFNFLTKIPSKGAVYTAPAWEIVNGEAFISFGSVDKKLYLYKLVGRQLEPLDEHFIGGQSHASTYWFDVDDRKLLAAITNEKLSFYELKNEKLEFRSELMSAGRMIYLQALLNRGKQNFIVGSTHIEMYLIKTIETLSKPGGGR